MELEELYALMERFARSGLTDLEWEREGEKIALRCAPAPVVVSAPAAAPAAQAAPVQAEAAAPAAPGGHLLCRPRKAGEEGGDPVSHRGHEDDERDPRPRRLRGGGGLGPGRRGRGLWGAAAAHSEGLKLCSSVC